MKSKSFQCIPTPKGPSECLCPRPLCPWSSSLCSRSLTADQYICDFPWVCIYSNPVPLLLPHEVETQLEHLKVLPFGKIFSCHYQSWSFLSDYNSNAEVDLEMIVAECWTPPTHLRAKAGEPCVERGMHLQVHCKWTCIILTDLTFLPCSFGNQVSLLFNEECF